VLIGLAGAHGSGVVTLQETIMGGPRSGPGNLADEVQRSFPGYFNNVPVTFFLSHFGDVSQRLDSGFEDYRRRFIIPFSTIIVVVFALNDRATFDAVPEHFDALAQLEHRSSYYFFLVGTKCDLEAERQITPGEVAAMAKRYQCAYLEVSAVANVNIDTFLIELAKRQRVVDRTKGKDRLFH